MSSSKEEVFKVSSYSAASTIVPEKGVLCAVRYNFLPDSLIKTSGNITVSKSGEVNVNFAGNQTGKTAKIEKISHSLSLRNVRRSRRLSSGNDHRSMSPVPSHVETTKRPLTRSDDDLNDDEDEINSLNNELFNDLI